MCAGFIYKSPRLSRECAERMDGIRGRSAAPPIFPLAFATLREAVILATESRDRSFHTHTHTHASRVLLLFTTGITSYQPAARRVGDVLKMRIGSVRRLGGNQHHPTLLPSIQHLRKNNNATFKMLNTDNHHPRFASSLGNQLISRIHFRINYYPYFSSSM